MAMKKYNPKIKYIAKCIRGTSYSLFTGNKYIIHNIQVFGGGLYISSRCDVVKDSSGKPSNGWYLSRFEILRPYGYSNEEEI
jgi:hypothetical protein